MGDMPGYTPSGRLGGRVNVSIVLPSGLDVHNVNSLLPGCVKRVYNGENSLLPGCERCVQR